MENYDSNRLGRDPWGPPSEGSWPWRIERSWRGPGGESRENPWENHGKITGKSMGKIRELNDFLASHVTDGWRLKSCAKYQDMS